MDVNTDVKFSDYLAYDETSPSCLRWVKVTSKYSRVKIGDVAGTLDKSDNYWRLHAFRGHYKVHRVVWSMHGNDFKPGYVIDHIDGDPSNNKISNLRQIPIKENGRNRSMNVNNTTLKCGVAFNERVQPSGKYFSKYTAHIYKDRIKYQKSFSIQKYGNELAFKLATEWRDAMIQELNSIGYGYTERHGT